MSSWPRSVPPRQPGRSGGYYQAAGDEDVVWCPEDVYIEEPGSLVASYLDACQRLGVQVLADEAVTAVLTTGRAISGLETAARRIDTPVVVDAAGAWVRQVGALAGARVPAAPVRHQLLITEPTAEVADDAPITRMLDHAVYLRPARGGLMVGGFESRPLPVDPRTEPTGLRHRLGAPGPRCAAPDDSPGMGRARSRWPGRPGWPSTGVACSR